LFNTSPDANAATLSRLTQRREVDQMNAQLRADIMARLLRGGAVTLSGDGQSR
jgi:hypothetical protein